MFPGVKYSSTGMTPAKAPMNRSVSVGPGELLGAEPLTDLRAGRAGGVDEQRVQHGAAGTVERVDALAGREVPVQHHRPGVEPHPAGGRRSRGAQLAEQAPPVQAGDAGDLDLMRGDGVTGEARPVNEQDPRALPGKQHRGRGARDPRADDDDVIAAHREAPGISLAARRAAGEGTGPARS